MEDEIKKEEAVEQEQKVDSQEEKETAPESEKKAAPEAEKKKDVATLLAELKLAQEALKDTRMRAQAEVENYKKRLEREHGEHLKYAAEKVMKDLIPTLDNLELAITYGVAADACQDMMKGIVMTQKLLLEAVGRHGLSLIGKEGELFNPAEHEAVGIASRPDIEPESIAKVMQSGYSLQGRVLRAAKVLVNKV